MIRQNQTQGSSIYLTWFCGQCLQNALGHHYMKGDGVAPNPVEAVKWYTSAALCGDAQAQRNLGLNKICGQGCEADTAAGIVWLQTAADQGMASAASELAYAKTVAGRLAIRAGVWTETTFG